MNHNWPEQLHRQYLIALKERDEAIERAEKAEQTCGNIIITVYDDGVVIKPREGFKIMTGVFVDRKDEEPL